jgi:O-antigen/teichoic acid export membrane protein
VTLRRSALWAVGDSAFSSLASFAIGLYALRVLTLEELGAYGVLFIATFVLASATVTQLYFTPVEVDLVDHPADSQLTALARSACRGLPLTAAIGLLSTAIGLLVIPELSVGTRLLLGVGAFGVSIFSPTQDHVRRILHQTGHSAAALAVSATQLVAAAGTLTLLATTDMARAGLPFAALAAANATSLGLGLVLAHTRRTAPAARPAPVPMASVLRLGWWLLLSSQAEQLSGFVGIAILGNLAGAVAVGQYEAARQLAQPLFVLSTGMQGVFRPRMMAATRRADRAAALRLSRAYVAALTLAGVVAIAAVGLPWSGNPLARFFPKAFEHGWVYGALLAASTFAFAIPNFAFQAIAARRERSLVTLTSTTSLVYVGLVALLARPLGPLALPLASLGNSAVWLLRFRPLFRSIFAGPALGQSPVAGPLGADA